jgi:hypothetical protein
MITEISSRSPREEGVTERFEDTEKGNEERWK